MNVSSTGDLSRAFSLRNANSRTKQLLTVLSRELSTGMRADLPKSMGGDTRRLSGIEHRLRTLDTLGRNCAEAGGRLNAGQTAMTGMQAISSGVGAALLATSMMTGAQLVETRLADARANLDTTIGLLNTGYGGEFVFAGSRSTTRPLADGAELLAAVEAAVTGLSDINDLIVAVDSFFDAAAGSGGFTDLAYRGGAESRGPVIVSPERAVDSQLTAASQPFRDLLKGLVLASLVAQGTVGTSDTDRLAAVQAAGSRILAADDSITRARSDMGVLQETVELARTRNVAEVSSLQIARGEIVSADPYEAAAALTEAQVQLETLYAVTARLSQLSLAKRL